MVNTEATTQAYTEQVPAASKKKMSPNPNQPKGEARLLAERMLIEQPYLSQRVIAQICDISEGRMGQIARVMDKEREQAQKKEFARLKKLYFLKK